MQRSKISKEEMYSHIRSWQQLGISQRQYCTDHQITYYLFHYWYRKFKEEQTATPGGFIQLPAPTVSSSMPFAEITFEKTYQETAPKSVIGKAVAYSLKLWDGLVTYTTDGKLNIDNNLVENAIRPVAIGRKNYLFAGSHEAAQRSAMLYSLFGTCKIHGVTPFEWMKDVLQKIPTYPVNQVAQLLPHNWNSTPS